MRGFDQGELTYDDCDDMVRDVRDYTSNLTLDHLLLLIERLKICQCGIFSRRFMRRPTAILLLTLLAQSVTEIHLLTVHRILRLREKALQGPVGGLTRKVALDVVRVVVLFAWWTWFAWWWCISWWT